MIDTLAGYSDIDTVQTFLHYIATRLHRPDPVLKVNERDLITALRWDQEFLGDLLVTESLREDCRRVAIDVMMVVIEALQDRYQDKGLAEISCPGAS